MPRDSSLKSVLILGAGPIVIGQACEFDYSGAQACKALREVGCRVILVNSNPATIMTDPGLADATYIEPLIWDVIERIIARERPDALLPTLGGQTALNCALDLDRNGVLEKYQVRMIGADRTIIDKAEDRGKFNQVMAEAGLETARSALAHSMEEALQVLDYMGFPCIVRPSFTLGGSGSGIAYNREEFVDICRRGLELSPTHELMIDESLIGWKEYEMEVVRDRKDNCIIVCSIENFDAMGVHTGDSITVAPVQTLSDREYQYMRDASIRVLRAIGVETGGANVQFAVHPDSGRLVVIEMNPRVSRSSALASKATGFPIAKVAAKLAVGFTLDELRNEITGGVTPASFEPTLDYVVTKIPRFDFEKFPAADKLLGTQMKAVGEVMGIGHSFQESLQKALCSMEDGRSGLDSALPPEEAGDRKRLRALLNTPTPARIQHLAEAFRLGMGVREAQQLTYIDPWFLQQLRELVQLEEQLRGQTLSWMSAPRLKEYKQRGFSDRRMGHLLGISEEELRAHRHKHGVRPVYKRVDSCAAEFLSTTAYLYSSYGEECEAQVSTRRKVAVLGSGPNRIGQGIEFDYCCVHAVQVMRKLGYESIMINCNPETVSTDYDVSDRLYFEPITLEHVLEILHLEQPEGVVLQFGGQTPLKLARDLEAAGIPVLGTSADAIDRAEDRERCEQMIRDLGLKQPPSRTVRSREEALDAAREIGYPLMLRPSYVLGGRAMEVVYNAQELERYITAAVHLAERSPVLLDRFLDDAVEVDVDAVCDGQRCLIGGVMEHIEQAGVHSGDSACSLPPFSLPPALLRDMEDQVRRIAVELGVVGLMNVQLAVQDGAVYILEVNPRASRTIPFVSKSIGISLAELGTRCVAGLPLREQVLMPPSLPYYCVKEAIFPFRKFPGTDPLLGPEMKSTGEVMGFGESFAVAYARAQLGAHQRLPSTGTAFLSVRDSDKPAACEVGASLLRLGFRLLATRGTATALRRAELPVDTVNKVLEGRPHIVDAIKNNAVQLIVNTTTDRQAIADSATIRSSALDYNVYYTTTLAAAQALCLALAEGVSTKVHKLQELQKLQGVSS